MNNGEERQAFNTDDMAHKIQECIEFISRIAHLGPGDIISTGTNHQGLGALQDGDKVDFTMGRYRHPARECRGSCQARVAAGR